MKTFKLSYSIINAWSTGNFEQAIALYLGKPYPATPAMELGKLKDEFWNNHVIATKEIHPELGGGKVDKPVVQQKYEKRLPFTNDVEMLLRGVPDMVDGTICYDWKCGLTTPSNYVDKMQMDFYKLLLPQLNLGVYLCYNPYNDTYSKGIKFLHKGDAENALDHIITFGSEIYDYLIVNKLFIDFRG